MPQQNKAEVFLVNLLIKPGNCPACHSEETSMVYFPSEEEKSDPDLMYMKCSCDKCPEEWIEVYRFIGVKYGAAYGPLAEEAWVNEDELKTFYVSIVNEELLVLIQKALQMCNELPCQQLSKVEGYQDTYQLAERLQKVIKKAKGE